MSSGEEILRYLDDTAEYFGIKMHTKFNTEVQEAVWLESEQKWEIITDEGDRLRANFIIDGTGRLHKPLIPEFKGNIYKFSIAKCCTCDDKKGLMAHLFSREGIVHRPKFPHCRVANKL